MMAEKVINSPRARVRGLDVDGSINTGNSSPLRPRGREGEKMLCSWREACKAADYVLGGYRVRHGYHSKLPQVRQAKLGRTNSGRSYVVKKSTYD